MKALTDSWHYITGLAGIGAASALAATHMVPGNDALSSIMLIVGALVGGGIAVKAGQTTP